MRSTKRLPGTIAAVFFAAPLLPASGQKPVSAAAVQSRPIQSGYVVCHTPSVVLGSLNTSHPQIIRGLKEGSPLTVEAGPATFDGRDGSWYIVRSPSGQDGLVSGQYVCKAASAGTSAPGGSLDNTPPAFISDKPTDKPAAIVSDTKQSTPPQGDYVPCMAPSIFLFEKPFPGKYVEKLKEGSPVTVLGRELGWFEVKSQSGKVGYINKDWMCKESHYKAMFSDAHTSSPTTFGRSSGPKICFACYNLSTRRLEAGAETQDMRNWLWKQRRIASRFGFVADASQSDFAILRWRDVQEVSSLVASAIANGLLGGANVFNKYAYYGVDSKHPFQGRFRQSVESGRYL